MSVKFVSYSVMYRSCHEFRKLVSGNLFPPYTYEVNGCIYLTLFTESIDSRHNFPVDEIPCRTKNDKNKRSHMIHTTIPPLRNNVKYFVPYIAFILRIMLNT